jgi:outer membrane protein assembly factor BamB
VAGDLALAVSGSRLEAYDLAASVTDGGWEVDLPGLGGDNDALTAGDALLVRAADGSLYRVDARTGEIAWRVLPDKQLLGTAVPALGFDRLLAADTSTAVVAVDDEHVIGVDLSDGRQRWLTTAASSAGTVERWVVASGVDVSAGERVVGLEARTGRRLWELAVPAAHPVAARDVVVLDDELSAVGVEPRTGEVLWRRATAHRPLLGSDPEGESVVVLDSPSVPHGMNDCC